MNFCDILVIVYVFGEFGCIKYVENTHATLFNEVQIAGEPRRKMRRVKRATEKAAESFFYRHSKEEPLRIKANERIAKFQSHTHTTFSDTQPQKGWRAKRLWNKARKAVDKYAKSKNLV